MSLLVPLALAGGALAPMAEAQPGRTRITASPDARPFALRVDDADPYAAIGVSTSASGGARDTLGLLVSSVLPGSPAERAGIEEGSRIAAVNGVNLRLSPDDIGDREMAEIMSRRLTREMRKAKPGDEVELRVYQGGSTRNFRVRTVSSEELLPRRTRRIDDDRGSIGIGIGTTGSKRDTLGVLVMYVADDGPAARAGMEEGSRIAEINGVDLRVTREDAGDAFIASVRARRLQRELSDLKPGDDVEMRVYQNGTLRTMRLKAMPASELPRRGSSFFYMGGAPIPPMPPMPPTMSIPRPGAVYHFDGAEMGGEVRRAIERAMEATGSSLEGLGRAFEGFGRGFRFEQWHDDAEQTTRFRQ